MGTGQPEEDSHGPCLTAVPPGKDTSATSQRVTEGHISHQEAHELLRTGEPPGEPQGLDKVQGGTLTLGDSDADGLRTRV